MSKKLTARYLVTDPEICHGQPTIRGTRILVVDVLQMVAEGRKWESISEAWGGKVSEEAIAEAVSLANQVFMDYVHEYSVEPVSA